uniref:CHK kinase-like domain-containing protein n=1 Tax=Lygus hesperus TaxID=30085 RepID=A0A0K8SXE9_LYGHE
MATVTERLEKLAFEGAFGKGNPLRVLNATDEGKGEQLQPELVFMQVDMIPNNGKIKKVPVVVKTQLKPLDPRDPFDRRTQFFNEATMYKSILPELGADNKGSIPTLYHAEVSPNQDVEHDIIVIEDLRPQGFKSSPNLFLDYDHVCLTLRKLGEFHGLSYRMKKRTPGRLQELAAMLIPRTYPVFDGMHEACILRGFKSLIENSPTYSVANRVYKKISSKSAIEFTSTLHRPEEPFAVMMHGDFNRNNILYSYGENGQVNDMRMINFAFSMYGEPSADIAFFLYLNTSPDSREKYWHEFLDAYWSGVTSVVEDPGFSYNEFLKNFAQKAVCGYSSCSHVLPVSLNPGCISSEQFNEMTSRQKIEFSENVGGEESTAAVTAIVKHLLSEGYLEEYLLHFKFDPDQK